MKTITTIGLLGILAACSSSQHNYKPAQGKAPTVPNSSAAKAQEASIELPAQPTGQSLQQEATKSINSQNADAEFQKLKEELSGG